MEFRQSAWGTLQLASWLAVAGLAVLGWHAPAASAQETPPQVVLRGHLGPVMMGALTPDGEQAVTVSADQTIRIWDASSGQELQRLTGHTGPLYALAISGDGRSLVTGAQDNTLRLWDVPQSKPVLWLAGHDGTASSLAISADGRWLASGGTDKLLRLWETASLTAAGEPNITPDEVSTRRDGHDATITSAGFRNDGNLLATGDASGRIALWSPYIESRQAELGMHQGVVTGLAFHANNQHLISAGDDGAIGIWLTTPQPPRKFDFVASPIIDIEVLTNQSNAVVASADAVVRLLDLNNGNIGREFPKSDAAVTALAASPDTGVVAIGDQSGVIRLFNIGNAAPRGVVAGHEGPVNDVAFHADSRTFSSAGEDGTIRMWQIPAAVNPLNGHAQTPRALARSHRGDWFVSTGDDHAVRVWNSSGQSLRTMANHQQPVVAVAASPNDSLIVSGDTAGVVWLWQAGSGNPQGHLQAHDGPVTALQFDRSNQTLLTAGEDGVIRQWKLPTPPANELTLPDKAERSVQVSPNGQPVAATALAMLAGDAGFAALTAVGDAVMRWKPDGTPSPSWAAPAGRMQTLAVNPDATQLLATNQQGQGFLWNAEGRLLTTLDMGGDVTSVDFSHDGQSLAVADGQPRVRIFAIEPHRLLEEITLASPAQAVVWSGLEGTRLGAIGSQPQGMLIPRALQRWWDGLDGAATAVAATPDGARVIAGSSKGELRQWRASDGQLERTLAGHTGAISDLAVLPTGQQFLSAGDDRTLRQWNVGDGAAIRSIDQPAAVDSVSISGDSRRLAIALNDGRVRVGDVATGQLLQEFPGHAAGRTTARWLNDNQSIVSASADKSVRVQRLSLLRAFALEDPVVDMDLYTGGNQILTCHGGSQVVMSDFNTGQPVRVFEGTTGALRAVASRADNQRIAAGTDSGKVGIWNAGNAELLQTLDVSGAVTALVWSRDNQKLAVATDQSLLYFFGPPLPPLSPQPGRDLVEHQQTATPAVANRLVFATNNRSLWATHADGHVAQWAYASPIQLRQFNHGGPVYAVAISRDGRTIVSGSNDRTVRIWDVTTGQQRAQLSGHGAAVHAVALSPDESLIVSSSADQTVRLWDIVGAKQLKQLAVVDETKYAVAIHPNGQTVAAGGADRKIHLINLLTGATERELDGHDDYIHSVTFNPSGTRLLSYTYAGDLRVWDSASDRQLFQQVVGRIGNFASYAPDGAHVLLSNGDGTARLIELPASAR